MDKAPCYQVFFSLAPYTSAMEELLKVKSAVDFSQSEAIFIALQSKSIMYMRYIMTLKYLERDTV